ncbi:hypothetical protein LTR50_001241 [Elasticomyces elasticus]|nr:hypothetical protein LTR50_001241 [Elasticomyces elasticus]
MASSEHPFSSQGSQYDQERLIRETLTSSPLAPPSSADSRKPKKPPPITPKRFTKFFTPRVSTLASRGSGRSGRQLRDITRNAINRKTSARVGDGVKPRLFEDVETAGFEDITTPDLRPSKRRKRNAGLDSSPPQSSPIKQDEVHSLPFQIHEDVSGSEESVDSEIPESRTFQLPIRRLGDRGTSQRILQRSFGGARAIANSLVAIGDEEGNVRLLDSASGGQHDFTQTHIIVRPHHNAVMDLAFSSDDYLLATASGDQTGRIIDMHTQETKFIMAGHVSSVKQVRFQPGNDSVVATSSRDGSVQLWDLRCRGQDGSVQEIQTGFEVGSSMRKSAAHRRVVYASTCISIAGAHSERTRTISNSCDSNPRSDGNSRTSISITALSFLPAGREHLVLTASQATTSVKLWDIRGKHTSRKGPAVPVSSTLPPESHGQHRHFGISSLVSSGDASRLYAVSRDNTVYAYSMNHLVLGSAPELSRPAEKWRRLSNESKAGLGPLYGFRHPKFHVATFYVKAAVRRARGDQHELLAVGSSDGCSVLFPTDEKSLRRPEPSRETRDDQDAEDDGLPTLASSIVPPVWRSTSTAGSDSVTPIFTQGTPLVRGHSREVTNLTFTPNGELVTVGDDFRARCWRQGDAARDLRMGGEREGRRWGCGWADVDGAWDDDEG